MLLQLGKFHSFLRLRSIPLYLCTASSLSFTCRGAPRLLPFTGCRTQCCSEHRAACIILRECFCFLYVYTQTWNCWITCFSIFNLLRDFRTVLHSGHSNFHTHLQQARVPFSLHPRQHLLGIFIGFELFPPTKRQVPQM